MPSLHGGERGANAHAGHHGAGAALDMSALGIQKHKTCWVLQVDALVLNAEAGGSASFVNSVRF